MLQRSLISELQAHSGVLFNQNGFLSDWILEKYIAYLLTACSLRAPLQLVAVTFSKQIIPVTVNCREKPAKPYECLTFVCVFVWHSKLRCHASAAFRRAERRLTVYLQMLIAGNGIPSSADQQTRLQQPLTKFKYSSSSHCILCVQEKSPKQQTSFFLFLSWDNSLLYVHPWGFERRW